MSELHLTPPAPDQDWSRLLGVESPTLEGERVAATELAAQLAGRLCHDFISPASAIVSGIDLLEDPSAADMRADAMNLIEASAKKLVALLAFSRVAFGASNTAETFDVRDLKRLTEGVFAHVRAELDWKVELAGINKPGARALLNMAQIGAAALPTGGVATITAVRKGDDTLLSVDSQGPRARLRPEVLQGLRGEPLVEGLGGNWVQAYYLHALLQAADGRCDAVVGEGRVTLRARCPAD